MKTIPYINKETGANTDYTTMLSTDKNWIKTQCEMVVIASALSEYDVFNVKNPKLPRHDEGSLMGKMNTYKSFCEGVIEKINSKGLNDLSHKQMRGLEAVFKTAVELDKTNNSDNFEEVVFEEVDMLPKIQLTKSQVIEDAPPGSFAALFEVEVIIRRKN